MSGDVRAAGALLWRERGRRLQVAVVHRPSYNDWSWPKGKPDDDEPLPVTAVREVEEETGIRVILGQPLGTVRYRLPGGKSKESTYWAARGDYQGPWEHTRAPVRRAPMREVDEVRWVDAHQALRMLTYDRDRVPLRVLMDKWDDDRLDSWTVVVARHGRARKRSAWKKGDEETRPLTAVGERQAALLVPFLSAFGVDRVVSSPWKRCYDTVLPYATAARVEVEVRPELTEAAHEERPKAARAIIDRELRMPGEGVVICTHRPVLPTVMSLMRAFAPARLEQKVPSKDPWLMTGEFLVAHLTRHNRRGVTVVDIERHRPYSL
ncbi:MAG TPA: NUDIX hydrolase [Actinomycetaceae bacterium]|nr:NUDIX hydrolase [Actinomycetaceae bacterium]